MANEIVKSERKVLQEFATGLELFRDANQGEHIELQTVLSFIYVALEEDREEGGLNVKDIAERLGTTTASRSRNCTLLSSGFRTHKKKGLELIQLIEDPMCRIKKIVSLTDKGRSFKRKLTGIFA